MSRLDFLKTVTSLEDKIQLLYDRASKKIKSLPRTPGAKMVSKAIMKQTDEDAHELIMKFVRKGAEMGEVETIRQGLQEMKRGWKV